MMLHYKTYKHKTSIQWLVFIHGFGGDSSIWYKQIQDFAQNYNLLLIDLKGHGKSQPKLPYHSPYSYNEIATDIVNVLDFLQIENCHFLGVSLGTIVVRKIAEMNPERVKTMSMAGAVVKFNFRSKVLMFIGRRLQKRLSHIWIYQFYAKILMPKKRHSFSRRLFVESAKKMEQEEFIRWFSLTADIGKLLRSFRAVEPPIPTLYVMGDEDYMFLPQVNRLVKQHKQNTTLIVVPNSGHVCNIDNAPYFNQSINHFLNGISIHKK